MTDPLFPSSLLAPVFSSAEMRALLADRARVQRMLDFESALARAEAAVGIIPSSHLGPIGNACDARHYDLAALAEATVQAGNLATPVVNALTAEVAKSSRKASGFVHWGATGQDVIDTALVLELRAVIDELFKDLDRATKAFITLAGRNRRNMSVARTQLQQALPMPFGLKLAGYAAALSRSRDRLRRLRKEALVLQFGGAAGTLAALGEKGLDVSERLAALLDLTLPDSPWHSHRDRLAEVASALAILAGTCGKIARDVALLAQNEVAEAFETGTPGREGAATLLSAQIQEHERAVGGWQAEWVTFPALALTVSGALRAVTEIAEGLNVDVERMKANLEATGGLVFAEAVSFALAERLGRAEAHELVAELTRKAATEKRAFKDIVAQDSKIKLHINETELERLFMPNHYQGAAQTFIDRLVASSQGRTMRRIGSTVSHLTDPKMPTARPGELAATGAAAVSARASVAPSEPQAKPPVAAEVTPAAPDVKAEIKPEKSAEPLGDAVAAASALIAQTISELAKPPVLPKLEKPAARPEPAPVVNVVAEAPVPAAEPVSPAPAPEIAAAPIPEPAPVAEAAVAEPAPQQAQPEPEAAAAVVADAPALDQAPADESGALLEMFARAAENENEPAAPEGERKPA